MHPLLTPCPHAVSIHSLGNGFINYPNTLQLITFGRSSSSDSGPVDAATSDGQPLSFDLKVYYRLDVAKLDLLYKKYEQQYKSNYIRVITNVLKDTASRNFATTDYFENRELIQTTFQSELNNVFLGENTDLYASTCLLFELYLFFIF